MVDVWVRGEWVRGWRVGDRGDGMVGEVCWW